MNFTVSNLRNPAVAGAAIVMAALAVFRPALAAESGMDAEAVQTLIRKSNCFKCHAIDKVKDGPSFQATAAKFKNQASAADLLVTYLKTSPKIVMDGIQENHVNLKTKHDAEILGVVRYILSL
jgi:cytochrome c